MKIAIIGNRIGNNYFVSALEKAGHSISFIDPLLFSSKINGEPGNFLISTAERSYEATSVIILAEDFSELWINTKNQRRPLSLLNSTRNITNDFIGLDITILLDYPCETDAHVAVRAVQQAVSLAKVRNNIVVFSRFFKAPGNELEKLYDEARKNGVIFVKYLSIEKIDHAMDTDKWEIVAIDEFGQVINSSDILIDTLIDKNKQMSNDSFTVKLKKAGLRQELIDSGISSRFFAYPGLTNRKGIYICRQGMDFEVSGDREGFVEKIIADLNSMQTHSLPAQNISESYITVPIISAPENGGEIAGDILGEIIIDAAKCAFCYTCFRACPHGAMVPDYKNSIMMNQPKACDLCGICTSICPANAVSLSSSLLSNQKEVVVSEKRNKFLVLSCSNSAYIAAENLNDSDNNYNSNNKIEFRKIACGGEISTGTLLEALKSYTGVIVAVCHDKACRHLDGSRRAEQAVNKTLTLLKKVGLDDGRLMLVKLSHATGKSIIEKIHTMCVV